MKSLWFIVVWLLIGLEIKAQTFELGADMTIGKSDSYPIGSAVFLNVQQPIVKNLRMIGGLRLGEKKLDLYFSDEEKDSVYEPADDEDHFYHVHLHCGLRYLQPLINREFNQQIGLCAEAMLFFNPLPQRRIIFVEKTYYTHEIKSLVEVKQPVRLRLEGGWGVGIYYKMDDTYFIFRIQFNSIDPFRSFRSSKLKEYQLNDYLPEKGQVAIGLTIYID